MSGGACQIQLPTGTALPSTAMTAMLSANPENTPPTKGPLRFACTIAISTVGRAAPS